MDPCIHTYYVDLRNGIEIHRERQPLAVGDRNADRYYVHVQKCGKRYDLTGAVVIGKVLRPDQHTVLLDGDVIDGAAVITLDEHCYAVPGEIKLTVVISAGGVTNAVMILTAEVLPSESDSIVENETVGSLADLAEILADLKDHNVRGTLDAVQDCVYPIPADVHWVSGPVLGAVGMPTSVISTERLDGSCYRVIADDGIEHRWWYYYDGYDANDSNIGTSQWLDGDSLAAEHVPGAAENVRVNGVKIEFCKADGTEVDDFSEITDYVSVMTAASLETVLYTAQELTADQQAQARRNIGAMSAATEIPAPYQLPTATTDTLGGVKVGDGLQMDEDVLSAEVTRADVDRLSKELATKAPAIECSASGSVITVTDAAARPAVEVVSTITAVQEGEGDPSPDNVRPIVGWDRVNVKNDTSGQTLTADLPETVYGGTLDWTTGELLVTYERVVLRGTEDWKAVTGSVANPYFFYILSPGHDRLIPGTGLCSHWQTVYISSANANIGYHPANSAAGDTRIIIRPDNVEVTINVAPWRDYLAEQYAVGTPVTITYELATPYTIQLTPQQLDMLKGANNVWSACGDTSLVYVADTKLYIDNQIAAIATAALNS